MFLDSHPEANSVSLLRDAHSKSYTAIDLKHSEQTANISTYAHDKNQIIKASNTCDTRDSQS